MDALRLRRRTLARRGLFPFTRHLLLALLAAFACCGSFAEAQVSFSSAIALALSSSPRVRIAQADVVKARAALAETHDAYAPTVEGVMDLGYSYGAPIGEPTLFSFTAHSLVFSYSQKDYTRAARSGLAAANLVLAGVRQEIAEDAAITYLSLDAAQKRRAALAEQHGYATQLSGIIQERLDAGQDTQLEALQARHTAAQINLQMLLLDDEIESYRGHLARIDGLPAGPLTTESGSIPPLPADSGPGPSGSSQAADEAAPDTPAVAAAFATARARQEQAFGDSRYRYRPQVSFFAEYSRFSTFNNYQIYYPAFANNTLNAIGIGIQIKVPFYDRVQHDKAVESSADAVHAQNEALFARSQMQEGRVKLQHASAELAAQAELASLDQQIAQQQLDAVLIQLQAGTGNPSGAQLTPKDEQNARIQERQHYLDLLDAKAKLSEIQIQLLRQTGQLDAWIKAAMSTPVVSN